MAPQTGRGSAPARPQPTQRRLRCGRDRRIRTRLRPPATKPNTSSPSCRPTASTYGSRNRRAGQSQRPDPPGPDHAARSPIRTRGPARPRAHHHRDVHPGPRSRPPPRRPATVRLPTYRRRPSPQPRSRPLGTAASPPRPRPDDRIRRAVDLRPAPRRPQHREHRPPLNDRGIPSLAAHDPVRNRHRTRTRWTLRTVAAILENPRYTGRQVWNRQRPITAKPCPATNTPAADRSGCGTARPTG
jgi:hypothetical protein